MSELLLNLPGPVVVEVQSMLTDAEWWQVVRGQEDGVLPPCCGDVSTMRDSLTRIDGGDPGAPVASSGWVSLAMTSHELSARSKVDAVRARVRELLVEYHPNWMSRIIDVSEQARADRLESFCVAHALNANNCGPVFALDNGIEAWRPSKLMDAMASPDMSARVVETYFEIKLQITAEEVGKESEA